MKKVLAGLMVAALASVAVAQTPTYSQNAVGFINFSAEATTQLFALCMPFDNMDNDEGTWEFLKLDFITQAPEGSELFIWGGDSWKPFTKKARTGWTLTESSPYNKFTSGQLFFFRAGKVPYDFTLSGEVPDAGLTVIPIAPDSGLSAIGNPYPTDIKFTETDLYTNAPDNSQVFVWSGESWKPYTKKARTGWTIQDGMEDNEIPAGEGFFIQIPKSKHFPDDKWDVPKGYEWP